jgi:hypothetical protein
MLMSPCFLGINFLSRTDSRPILMLPWASIRGRAGAGDSLQAEEACKKFDNFG